MTHRALLFTDVVDSTQLVEQVGDERAAKLWAEHDRRARSLLDAHRGREIDRTDGFFLLFDAAADAARYALDYHRALADLPLVARVGLHVGAVVLRDNPAQDVARGAKPVEVEGVAKPFAARVMALARGGQTLLSAAARTALGAAVNEVAEIECHGHYRLKGIETPAQLFELGARGACHFAPPQDAEKAYRVVAAGELWRPVREVRHNLPAERDTFVGRSAELRALAQRLDAGARLLTVLGPAGTGKTRLVRRYGWSRLGDWPGGVYFCDLSDARSLDAIFSAVGVALGVPLDQGDPGVRLGHAIAGRGRCLIVLDNFEQVVEHAGSTLSPWLDRAAEASFVVTSRERLHLPGEELFPVEPLPPERDAIELFESRARAQRSDFAVTAENRAAVAEVVRLIDGLPLAIELAAARIRVLSPQQLVERIRDRFALLGAARGTAARQATLRAAIDWSWELLAPWEQAALAQCSVFEGGFTLAAAQAVLDLTRWSEAPSALDAVQSLVDKSLLRSWIPAGDRFDIEEPYFGMYLSIHEYAAQRLRALGSGAVHEARVRHGTYFAAFGTDEAIRSLAVAGGVRRRRLLAYELDNLVAACRGACGRGDSAQAVACYLATWEVLQLQGPYSLGIELGTRVLATNGVTGSSRAAALLALVAAGRHAGRVSQGRFLLDEALDLARAAQSRGLEARALIGQADMHRLGGSLQEAGAVCGQSLSILDAIGDRRFAANGLMLLGLVRQELSQYAQALSCLTQARAVFRELGDRHSEGQANGNLGIVLHLMGSLAEARVAYEEAISIHREVGDRSQEGVALGNLGDLACDQGHLPEGRENYRRSLAIHREVGNRHFEGRVLGNLAATLQEQGLIDEALAHYELALAIYREVDDRSCIGYALGNLGMLRHLQGHNVAAREHYDLALAHHRRQGDRRGEGIVLGSLAALLADQGVDEYRAMSQAGETLLRAIGDPLGLAKLLCKRATADARFGLRDASRAALAQAQAIAVQLGLEPESELEREIARLRAALS